MSCVEGAWPEGVVGVAREWTALTANSACSRWAELTAWWSCRRLSGRPADSRNSLAAASLGVATVADVAALALAAVLSGSTVPSADMSSTRETLEPRLQGAPHRTRVRLWSRSGYAMLS